MTEETAREAVNQIRTPIDKARSVAKQQEKNKEFMFELSAGEFKNWRSHVVTLNVDTYI